MARYRWTHGTDTRTMPIGTIDTHLMSIFYATPYQITYDDITYTIYKGAFNYGVAPYLSAGYFFDTQEDIHGETWNSGALVISINAYGYGTGYQSMEMYDVGVPGQTPIFVSKGWGFETSNFMGIMALAGLLNGTSGIFFFVGESQWTGGDRDLEYQEFIFLPDDVWELSDVIMPYAPDGQEFPDGTPEGGYGSGTANKGDATPGATPSHPIVSGRGVHYMLVNDAQLSDFSDHMWGRGTGVFETLWQKWENYKFNPMAGVLTCHALPTDFYPAVAGAASAISIAGTSVPVSCTAVSAGIVQQTYTESLADILQYGSFLDFDYLKIYAHIPFCGICEIPPSACVGGSVQFIYRCDVLTGNVACWVCTVDRFGASHQINCLTGNCAYTVPITGNDNGMSTIIGALSSNLTAMVGSFEKGAQAFATGGSPGAGGLGAESSTANALRIAAAQHHTQVSGNVSGSAAILANNHLFLDITYANPSYPSTMLSVRGTPSDRGGTVGTFAGTFTVFSDVHADAISSATPEEKNMIEQALKSGVFV